MGSIADLAGGGQAYGELDPNKMTDEEKAIAAQYGSYQQKQAAEAVAASRVKGDVESRRLEDVASLNKLTKARAFEEETRGLTDQDETDVYIKSLARAASERAISRSQGTYSAMRGGRGTKTQTQTKIPTPLSEAVAPAKSSRNRGGYRGYGGAGGYRG